MPERFDPAADPSGGPRGPETLQVCREEATVRIAETVTGRVTVQTTTQEVEQVLHETLRTGAVSVQRIPRNDDLPPGAPLPRVRTEGPVMIVPVIEEYLFVEKRLRLTEELHITSTETTDTVDVPVILRRQSATVRRD